MRNLLPNGSIMRKDDYWPIAHKLYNDKKIEHMCEFISLHYNKEKGWSLYSPMFIVDQQENMRRPIFEDIALETFAEGLQFAIRQALEYKTFVVIVDDPVSLKTMQPSRQFEQV